jgi:hypothetical protein
MFDQLLRDTMVQQRKTTPLTRKKLTMQSKKKE